MALCTDAQEADGPHPRPTRPSW